MNGLLRAPGRVPVGALFTLLALTPFLLAAGFAQEQHLVEPGDTLYALAERYATSVAELRAINELESDLLRVGQLLELPAGQPTGFRVSLAPGQSLLDVALSYGVAPADLLRANGLASLSDEVTGGEVLIPRAGQSPVPDSAYRGEDSAGDETQQTAGGSPAERHDSLQRRQLARLPELLAGFRPLSDGFVAPLSGRLSSRYGWRNISVAGNRFHGGIDIAADHGAPVVAAADGRVARAGWIGAYGYAVYLEHADGVETRYGHLSQILVSEGDFVRQGDVVGLVGSSGASTGPHLHFELRIAGASTDPLAYLPGAD